MSGFDNGTMQGGVVAQTQQFGAVLRGLGPPVSQVGVMGSFYLDTQTWELYARRGTGLDPWGHSLYVLPATYQPTLKWFTSNKPANDIGANGDYCLLAGGYPNYGIQPSIYGPKAAGAWPANPVNVVANMNPLYSAEDVHGV